MNQAVRIRTNVFRDYAKHFLGDNLTVQDRQEIALKAMAVVAISPIQKYNFSVPNNGIDKIILEAETKFPEIFVNNGNQVLSERIERDIFLLKMIDYFSECAVNGSWTLINKKAIIFNILEQPGQTKRSIRFADDFYTLCQRLFDKTKGDVYLPNDESLIHEIELISDDVQIFTEINSFHIFTPIISLILGNVSYHVANPVLSPSYVTDGKLQTFAKGFLAGVWRTKVEPKEIDDDRFVVMGNNYQHYLTQHLFAQVSDLALVCMPQNTLTANVRADVAFREWLIDQKHLAAVVSLPNAITNNGINYSLMIFDLKNDYETVRFISLKDSDFVEKNQLTDIDNLVAVIHGDDFENAVNVDHRQIIEKNFALDPERYVLNHDSLKALAFLDKYKTVKLGNIADIIRPYPISKKDEGEERILEIQSGDLPSYGYITHASKRSLVNERAVKGVQASQVQAGDIIMTIRGTTGKVGLVSQALLDGVDLPMVAGQTGVIIRPDPDKINPIALYMQLHSAFAQSRLALLSVGSAIAGLSIKDLKEFKIAWLSGNDEQKLIENFEQQCQINAEILQKQQLLADLNERFWQ